MKVRIDEVTERSARVLIEGVEPAFANAIRRCLIADLPKLAIDDVEFHLGPIRAEDGKEAESIAPLFDEIVAHRLGLIPLPTDPELFVPRQTCPACGGEGCPNCTVIYSLNKRGPCTVYSGDLEPIGDAKFKPVDPNIPIVKLGEGQALLVYATAQLGYGREHAKWQATQAVGYKYRPVVKVDNRKMDPEKFPVEVCPVRILHHREGKVAVEPEEDCILCMGCVEAAKENGWDGAFDVYGDPARILFHFETDGSMSAKTAVLETLAILETKFSTLADQATALE
ncbi:MAG: DNA-directed RNA polymerase subunit D [Euryarchaeota archaeon]|nr:DNA-directed RNA polymerase subunit D [Euryarchaeota archaeon]